MKDEYNPMMEPNYYCFWRTKFHEHGLTGVGNYWYSGDGAPRTFLGARQLVAMRELPAAVKRGVIRISESFARMARMLDPEIRKFHEDLARAGLLKGESVHRGLNGE